jgi:hypothetical protein
MSTSRSKKPLVPYRGRILLLESHHDSLEAVPAGKRFAALIKVAKEYIDPHSGGVREDLKLLAVDRPVYMLVAPKALKGLKRNKGWDRLLYMAYQKGKPKMKCLMVTPEVHARIMATKSGSVNEHLTRLMDMREGLFDLNNPRKTFSHN